MLQVAHPFTVTDADHCETDVDALRDVCWILKEIASSLSKQPADLRIYDPYFCEGAIVRHWASLGFRNCYNKNEDFYAAVEQGRVPEYDVLITNPPYAPYCCPADALQFRLRALPWVQAPTAAIAVQRTHCAPTHALLPLLIYVACAHFDHSPTVGAGTLQTIWSGSFASAAVRIHATGACRPMRKNLVAI